MPPERRPAIVAVDDDPAVLAAVARDLRRGFGERYRIVRAGSGADGLDLIRQIRARGEQVALLIADQRMPGMPGTDYLVEARKLVPDAKAHAGLGLATARRIVVDRHDGSLSVDSRPERNRST